MYMYVMTTNAMTNVLKQNITLLQSIQHYITIDNYHLINIQFNSTIHSSDR